MDPSRLFREVQALKAKLSEFERQTSNNILEEDLKQGKPDQRVIEEIEQYKRMENCLYTHRREWEIKTGPGTISGMKPAFGPCRKSDLPHEHVMGPWLWHWNVDSENSFIRPNPFDPFHSCGNDLDNIHSKSKDKYDMEISYGSRRDRARKNFEWEMDRLYLQEEVDNRRRAKAKEAAIQFEHSTSCVIPVQEAKLNRLDWAPFKMMAGTKSACVIDVLMGEPSIEEEVNSGLKWFGGMNQRARVLNTFQDHPICSPDEARRSPLPDRVRVHSIALLRIFAKLVTSEAGPLNSPEVVLGGKPVVFIRPFKLLVYCEGSLRDWYTALENRSKDALKPEGEPTPPIGNPASDLQAHTQKEPAETREKGGGDEKDDPDDITKSLTAMAHLKCLLNFIDSDIISRREYLHDTKCRKIFFSDLWLLFRPGVEVIGSDGRQAYRVIHVTSAKHRVNTPPFSITCVYIDFNGTHIGPISKTFNFKKFDGEREVTSLEVYPLHFHPSKRHEFNEAEWAEVKNVPEASRYRRKLIMRGSKFLEVAGVKHMYYSGPTLMVRDEVESQVVIDFETAFSAEAHGQQGWKPELEMLLIPQSEDKIGKEDCEGECCEGEIVFDDTFVDQKQRKEYIDSLLPRAREVEREPSVAVMPRLLKELRAKASDSPAVSDDELLIMSYRVFGFVLRSRKWAQLDLTYLDEVHAPAIPEDNLKQAVEEKKAEPLTAFDRLVLEEGHKPMIISLIAQHFRNKESRTGHQEQFDIVKGRGDLGTTAKEVERSLETNFALANRWDCILLLDEADVFLAERTKEDFKRNGLVAVFLRVLEYYAGILFLTTNRVGDFDEAFTSRIHISLYYPELSQEKTVEVFKINMDLFEERFNGRGRHLEIDRMGIGSFATEHFNKHPHARWNGRQVRNACQTALALAEFEAQGNSHQAILNPDAVVKLNAEHFRTVQKSYLEFTKYMDDLYGTNAPRRAKESRLRAIWIDENQRVVKTQGMDNMQLDKRAAFLLSSQPQPRPAYQGQPPPQQGFHHHVPSPMQPRTPQQAVPGVDQYDQYNQYSGATPTKPSHGRSAATQMPAHQFPAGQPWVNSPGTHIANTRHPGQFSHEEQVPSHPQQPQQSNPAWLDQNIRAMYSSSGPLDASQRPPGNFVFPRENSSSFADDR
ncbi:hypothetical protein GQ53DRAFT_878458 [Thozetella sp. PMI_491]|nr:hypothetical protein GQ53DRAFT_878458 [Thozetella sp. PMI_491]